MQSRRIFLSIGIIALSCAAWAWPARASAYDHVRNGGFEEGTSPWNVAGGTSLEISSLNARSGAHSAILTGDSRVRLSQRLDGVLMPGAYDLGASVRAEASLELTLSVRAGVVIVTEHRQTIAAGEWVDVSVAATMDAAAETTLIVEAAAPGEFVMYLDAVNLSGPPPVAPSPTATRTQTPSAATASTTAAATASETVAPTATVSPSPVPIGDGALINGGFESLATDGLPVAWDKFGGTLASDTRARSGAYAARLTSDTESTKFVHQPVRVRPAGTYAFEAWVIQDDADVAVAFLRIAWYESADGSGSQVETVDSSERLTLPDRNYRFLTTGPVTAPISAHSARVRIVLQPASAEAASITVDDAVFRAAVAPTATPAPTLAPVADGGVTSDAAAATRAGPRTNGALVGAERGRGGRGVVINEVLYDAMGDAPDPELEWVELYNAGPQTVSLGGFSRRDAAASDALPTLDLGPGGFAIVAATRAALAAFPVADVPVVVLGGRIGNALGNDGDRLLLVDAAGAIVDAVSWGTDTTALSPSVEDVPEGHSIERQVPGLDSDSAADFIDNESPSPGRAFSHAAAASQGGSAARRIEFAASGSRWRWVPWAVLAASLSALAGVATWRAWPTITRRP